MKNYVIIILLAIPLIGISQPYSSTYNVKVTEEKSAYQNQIDDANIRHAAIEATRKKNQEDIDKMITDNLERNDIERTARMEKSSRELAEALARNEATTKAVNEEMYRREHMPDPGLQGTKTFISKAFKVEQKQEVKLYEYEMVYDTIVYQETKFEFSNHKFIVNGENKYIEREFFSDGDKSKHLYEWKTIDKKYKEITYRLFVDLDFSRATIYEDLGDSGTTMVYNYYQD